MSWLALSVNLTHLESSERTALIEKLPRSDQPVGVSVGDCLVVINAVGPSPLWATPCIGRWFGTLKES